MKDQARAQYAAVGALMMDAGASVSDVGAALVAIQRTRRYDEAELSFVVMPGTVFAGRRDLPVPAVMASTVRTLSTRQAAEANRMVRDLEHGVLALEDVDDRIAEIRQEPAGRPLLAWIVGSGLVAVGLAVLFRCPWWAIALSAVTGAVVGAISTLMERITSASAIIPFVATLVSTLMVGASASWWDLGPVPLFAVCAPMAILVPGALITNGLLEMTASDIITGTARLVSGLVVLGFMAAGILAAGHLTGLHVDPGSAALVGDVPVVGTADGWSAVPGGIVVWMGVVSLGIGIGVAFRAGLALTSVTVGAMLTTYALLLLLTPLFGNVVATGTAGAVLFIGARLLERSGSGVPSAISFQPAFLLLVPGTVGLVALTTLDTTALAVPPLTFASLCIGTKVGSVVADAPWSRLRELRSIGPRRTSA